MADYRCATPHQITRVLDLAEITGVGVEWLDDWYRSGFGRSVFQMDRQTAVALIAALSSWPVRIAQPALPGSDQIIDVHHRTDERRGMELPSDVTAL